MRNWKTLVLSNRLAGVAQITMSRPDVFNAFDDVMIKELGEAFTEAENDDSVRVIVLSGAGKHFSAGADLQWMRRASEATEEWNLSDARIFANVLVNIERCSKPTVARIQGAALGGGVGLACACDIAIATDDSRFAVSEAKFGILPSVIAPHVINAVGKRQAKRLALTTTQIRAEEALRIGLIQQTDTLDYLDETVDKTLKELLSGSPNSQREIKKLFGQLSVGPINDEVVELTAKTISRVRGTDEAKEGFNAFLLKRPAKWIPEE
ncbi:enoyl-CoA hydratase-related protein [Cocleimonas sp. KMM 6892]|uniref:enoyl-CoA hydratase-related protein n=1 Tax=unclassified Cocleimonas TaxID=2639732 RepID=UPI002DB88B92|nr:MULTISPECIES: enoyl-CoA hydratase-related protein [unclassified Cocleimonas]MEB8432604.1 enoyl-CoA hydratase-related protein [Cocleimonas sp. KMM 6892]MEC4715463.1 enoyl-CoA hydratase-related protein [Cocleimonas sp. KMM 6895]MEC4744919.1 enoyl-CoA hydratase-related protein [Cocleimonas sp. KMM 6896]